jgi:hypothetical protein
VAECYRCEAKIPQLLEERKRMKATIIMTGTILRPKVNADNERVFYSLGRSHPRSFRGMYLGFPIDDNESCVEGN